MTKTIKTKRKLDLKFDIGDEVYYVNFDDIDVLEIFKAKIISIKLVIEDANFYYNIEYDGRDRVFLRDKKIETIEYFHTVSEFEIFKTKDEAVEKAIEMQRLRSQNQSCEDS